MTRNQIPTNQRFGIIGKFTGKSFPRFLSPIYPKILPHASRFSQKWRANLFPVFPSMLNIGGGDRFHAGVELTTRSSLGPGCINFPDRDHPPAKSNSGKCGHFRVSFHLCLYLTSPWVTRTVTRHRNRTNGTGISFEHYDRVAFAPNFASRWEMGFANCWRSAEFQGK